MSRQARIETDIEVKNADLLKEAAGLACKEVGGVIVDRIRYHSGDVLGIKVQDVEIGVVMDGRGRIAFVGEDIHLHSEIGRKIRGLVLKNYSSIGVSSALRKMGYNVSVKKGQKNILTGVRA